MNVPLISPSVLSADFGNLARDIDTVNKSEADWLHLDVMDGVFVPNISFGFPVISAVKGHSTKPLDVHLMISDPDRYLSRFRDAGADILTVHYEAATHLHRTVDEIKRLGMKAGVSINPHTPVTHLSEILPFLDLVLVMSVNPGFGGQSFIYPALEKLRWLRRQAESNGYHYHIEVDGGVDLVTAPLATEAGASVLVAGSAIFGSENPALTISEMKRSSK